MRSWWLKLKRRLVELRRLRSLGELFLFLRIFGFAAVVPLLMRLKLAQVSRLLTPVRPQSTPAPNLERVQRIAELGELALRVGSPLIRSSCLTRGLTRYYFFRRAGLEVDLLFGAGYPKGAFAAHCWLVREGEPFMETPDPRPLYGVTYTFPEGAPREVHQVDASTR